MSQALHDALLDLLNAAEGLMHPDAQCSATMAARLRITSSMDAARAALAAPVSGVPPRHEPTWERPIPLEPCELPQARGLWMDEQGNCYRLAAAVGVPPRSPTPEMRQAAYDHANGWPEDWGDHWPDSLWQAMYDAAEVGVPQPTPPASDLFVIKAPRGGPTNLDSWRLADDSRPAEQGDAVALRDAERWRYVEKRLTAGIVLYDNAEFHFTVPWPRDSRSTCGEAIDAYLDATPK